ncbi:MAG: hypothetical protein E7564_10390 [Ruminococcaceae bacterium]|nr:hypothetical protein [Oscillospiraceae bacterium]
MKDIFKDLIDEKVSEALSSAASKMEELQSKRDEINKLINSTVEEFRKKTEAIAKEQGVFTEKTYTDEPILFVASKMKNYTPKEITEMRKLEKGASWSALSDPGIFYKQAKFMENYEDDYEYKGDFQRFYPTYRSMSTSELRGYFTWRKKVRRGEITKTSLSFAFLYVYELLNLIGCENEFDGYNKLTEFFEAYGNIDPKISGYRKAWVNDFVVYYNLPSELYVLKEEEGADFQNALITLTSKESKSDTEIFNALTVFSSYNIKESPFYKEHSADVTAVTAKVYKKLCEYHQKHRKVSFTEKLFGREFKSGYFMFNAAVFYEKEKHPDTEYTVNPLLKFICKNGSWYQERTFHVKGKNTEIRDILKNIDCLMREKYNFKHKLTMAESTKTVLSVISESIEERLKENKEKEKKIINIDISKLQSIRDTSLVTANKLIVEEEEDVINNIEAEFPLPETAEEINEVNSKAETYEAAESENSNISENNYINETELDSTEFEFLIKLIKNENYKEFLKSRGIMLSIITDSVNEKLYDIFGDTVIDFDGTDALIIEDYQEELKGLINFEGA